MPFTGGPIVAPVQDKGGAVFNVKAYGAIGDDVSDDTVAVQAAIAAAQAAGGGRVYFPDGTFKTVASLLVTADGVTLAGASRTRCKIHNASANDVVQIGGAGIRDRFVVEELQIVSDAGNCFVVTGAGLGRSRFSGLKASVAVAGKSVFLQSAGVYVDNYVEDFDLVSIAAATTPVWKVVSDNGGCNTNTWKRGRITTIGNYGIWIENNSAGTYAYDNRFEDINFEVPDGGCIKVLSGFNTIIENCEVYDGTVSTRDFFYIGKNALAPSSKHTTIRNVGRRSGALGLGLVDVHFVAGENDAVVVEGGDNATLGGFTIDMGNTPNSLLIGIRSGVTLQNVEPSTVQIGHSIIAVGGAPAAGGNIRLSNGDTIAGRNAGGTADVSAISIDPNDMVALYGGGVRIGPNGFIEVGRGFAHVAGSGLIRMPNAQAIYARNVADSGDLPMIQIDANNVIVLGGSLSTRVATGLGLVGSPAYSFNGDLNTGIFSPGADDVALVAGGIKIAEVALVAAVPELGFFGAAPVARPAAYTLTYAGLGRILAADTSSDFPAGGVGAAAGAWDTAAHRDAAIAAFNALRVDVDNAKNVLAQVVADLKAFGLMQ